MKKILFNSLNELVYNKPGYFARPVGQISNDKTYLPAVKAKVASNDNSDCFYCGEPVTLSVDNEGNPIFSTFDTTAQDASLANVTFNAFIAPSIISYTNCADKNNNIVQYKVYDRYDDINTSDKFACVMPNYDVISMKSTEGIKFLEPITFTLDNNNVIAVKKAVSGDKVYGYAVESVKNKDEIINICFYPAKDVTTLS